MQVARITDLARAAKTAPTKRAYGSDFPIFGAWCTDASQAFRRAV
jgi:hypothetical protein